jgi:hypothetical protein
VAKDPVAKEVAKNVEVSEEPKDDGVKCDNHPGRKARTYTGNGAYEVNLCDECAPPWFKDEMSSL